MEQLTKSIEVGYENQWGMNFEQKELMQNNLAGMVQVLLVRIGSSRVDNNLAGWIV